jgi:DNA polymerase (family 10)
MDNRHIADVFQEMGDILEIQGANRFRVLAYQKAARAINGLAQELKDIYAEDPKKLEAIPGIGKDLAAKIIELLRNGKCQAHEQMLKTFDRGLLELLRVRGIGPKKVMLFYSELGIDSITKLKEAALSGQLKNLPKMGAKSEAEIIKALSEYDRHQERMLLSDALDLANSLITYLKKCPGVKNVHYAGSLRRMKDTIGDIDLLVSVKNPKKDAPRIMEHFIRYPQAKSAIAHGETKSAILLQNGVQSDLRVLSERIYGAALHYFTGSKAHNVRIREMAKKKGLKISEYGVFKTGLLREKLIAGETEQEVFKSVGLPYLEPEMREDRGEIEAALNNKLPKLILFENLKGDLHVHSRWSDGAGEIEEIARSYREAGFEYIALTDHSQSATIAHGLTPERFRMQWDEIDEINSDLAMEAKHGAPPFRILKGVECDILPNGKMDLPDAILKKMEVVVASVHSGFNMSNKEMTERVMNAFDNPYVAIFGHPSGRIINQREPYQLDMEKIIDAAVRRGIALEINGQPSRLDLQDVYCKMAKERGAVFTVDSDSHSVTQKDFLRFGIAVARRGWLEKKNVLNTLPLMDLLTYLARRR